MPKGITGLTYGVIKVGTLLHECNSVSNCFLPLLLQFSHQTSPILCQSFVRPGTNRHSRMTVFPECNVPDSHRTILKTKLNSDQNQRYTGQPTLGRLVKSGHVCASVGLGEGVAQKQKSHKNGLDR